jgi:Fur family ferric uptake transcriptional regulator
VSRDPESLLRDHGVQVTAQRLAVLAAVSGRPHLTADAVATIVRGEIGAISRQAVYDALGLLVEKGLIRRIQPDGSPARYEDRVGDNHHHLICRSCGHMVDVDCAVGAAPCLTPGDDSGYEIDEAEVIYWGRCAECLAQPPARSGAGEETVPDPRVGHTSDAGDAGRAEAHKHTDRPKGET